MARRTSSISRVFSSPSGPHHETSDCDLVERIPPRDTERSPGPRPVLRAGMGQQTLGVDVHSMTAGRTDDGNPAAINFSARYSTDRMR